MDRLKKKNAKAAIVLTAALSSLHSFAGEGLDVPVLIAEDFGFWNGQGMLFSARNAPNDIEYIGCQVRTDSEDFGLGKVEGNCAAMDAFGDAINCTTTDPDIIANMQGINPYSWVRFFVDGQPVIDPETGQKTISGECIRLTASNRSFYLPYFEADREKSK